MNMSFKKIIAGVTAVTIVAMNMSYLTVNAANVPLNGASATYAGNTVTLNLTAGAVIPLTTGTLTINIKNGATPIALNALTAQTITDGVTLDTTATNLAAGNYVLTKTVTASSLAPTVTLVLTNVLATGNYTVSFLGSNGDYGAVQMTVGTGNQVAVTASVVPVLEFALNTNTLALGQLAAGIFSTGSVTATVNTNAIGGVTVTTASTGLKTGGTLADREIGVNPINGTAVATTAPDYYRISTNSTPVFGVTAVSAELTPLAFPNTQSAAGANIITGAMVVYHTAAPLIAAVPTIVTIGAQIATNTEAGNYADTLTFTVSGTF